MNIAKEIFDKYAEETDLDDGLDPAKMMFFDEFEKAYAEITQTNDPSGAVGVGNTGGEVDRLKRGIYAIVAELRNDNPKTALLLARTVMYDGNVLNPLDIEKYRE